MDDAERIARARFFTIGIVRVVGAVTLALAVAIVMGRVTAVPQVAGYVLLVVGALEMVLVPQILVARWKSPPPS